MLSHLLTHVRYGIAAKLYFLSAISIAALIVLTAASIHFANLTRFAAERLYQQGMVGIQKVADLEVLFEQHRALIQAAPAEFDRVRLQKSRQTIDELNSRIEASVIAGPDLSDDKPLSEISRTFPDLKVSGYQVLRLAENFAQDKALQASQGEYALAADKINGSLKRWYEQQIEAVDREVSGLSAASRDLIWWVVAAALTGFVLIGPVTLWAKHRIVRRLGKLTAAMRRLCINDLAVNVPYTNSLDEMGDIARSIEVFKNNAVILGLTHARLDAALNNMSQGLCFFDGAERLIVCNDLYIDMYGLAHDRVHPGTTLAEIVDLRYAAGSSAATTKEEHLAWRQSLVVSGESSDTITQLQNGKIIRIRHSPMADGGWVATHEDITEHKLAEDDLRRTKLFLDTVIENVPLPLVVKTIRESRYTLLNRAGEDLFGIKRTDVMGKTPHDVYGTEHADSVIARDRRFLSDQPVGGDLAVRTPRGMRLITSKRVTIPGDDGNPEYLLTVMDDVTERRQAERRIEHMAHCDPLTDLPNRAAFNERLTSTMRSATAKRAHFAILCLDLDGFKEVNDVYGHAVGDLLLCQAADRFREIAADAFVARLGGDEFTIIADNEQRSTVTNLVDRLLAAFAADFEIDGHHLRQALSVGIAIYPDDGSDAETLMKNADAALYRAKAEGSAPVQFFEAEMAARLRERAALQTDLRTAVEQIELQLHYQPQLKMNGETTGLEALARWHSPKRGIVPPGEFIPLAEESSLILLIGEWVLREACREAASWDKPLKIAVNISPVQFRHGDLSSLVHSVLIETGLAPHRLELEITEGVLITDFSRAVSILRRLKSLGVQIALDDFGTGYSSLSYLHAFPFDKIKIDRTFISDLETNRHSIAIVRAVIGLSRSLDIPVLAEGVETSYQHSFLAKEGCNEVQGYFTGRPLGITDYAGLVGRKAIETTLSRVDSGTLESPRRLWS